MWLEWSAEAFARAATARKPVLLSLVTAWSDECAAMDVTTYVASRRRVAGRRSVHRVRVDADRRPDINDRYNLGGWPTTVFLTDRGDTLSGGTYLDAPQMMAALQQVADAYRDRADEISARSARLRAVRGAQRAARNAGHDPRATIAHFRSLLLERFDPLNGGFRIGAEASTSPCAVVRAFAGRRRRQPSSRTMAVVTLRAAARRSGTPASGGFFRYADGSRLDPAGNREDARGQRRAPARVRRSGAAASRRDGSSRRQRSCAGSRTRWPTRPSADSSTPRRRRNDRQDDVRRQERDDGRRVHQGGGAVRRCLAARLCAEVARSGHRAGVQAGRRCGARVIAATSARTPCADC